MQITAVRTRVVRLPIRRPVINRSGVFTTMWDVLIDVETDAGLTGSTYLWAYNEAGALALRYVLADLAEVVIGQDPFFTTRMYRQMWTRLTQWGRKGLSIIALSGIDMALWDIIAQAAGRPLAHVLGAAADRVPAYASEALWMIDDLDQLQREAGELVERGFRAMKMRLGRPKPSDDVAAVRAVREAIGPDITLMIDANQGWEPNYAIRIGRRLEEFDLSWIEEPVPHDDLTGHSRIAAALDTPIASGEKLYTPQGFRDAIEARAFDILMPDAERIGGVTGWMRTAALAEAWNLPICSHLFPEVSVHLVAASPTACFFEHMPWTEELFQEGLELRDGQALVPDRPGIGFTWNETAVRAYLAE